MTHWSRQCRCAGTVSPVIPIDPGTWCGRPADQEDGLCDECRSRCFNSVTLTMEQTQQRALLHLMAD